MSEREPLLTEEEDSEIERAVEVLSKDPQVRENHRYFATFSKDYGVLGARRGNRRGLSRREWIERHVWIKNKQGRVVQMVLNPAQRRLEAAILRMERRGVPVRVVILKARQVGFSTYIQAFCFWALLNISHTRCLMVAHRKPTARAIFEKIRTMRKRISRHDGAPYDFKLGSKSRSELSFEDPMNSVIEVDSAEVDEPGHGDTVQVLHKTETSRWKDALRKAKGLEQILPEMPGTYGFDETTANGDVGYFRDEFWAAYEGRSSNHALFIAWFEQLEYRWTVVNQRDALSPELEDEIAESLTEEEQELLTRRYFERGVGWRNVDLDQLAWRRHMIATKMGGNLDNFNEQYPSVPDEAFLASGRPIYDGQRVKRALAATVDPMTCYEIAPLDPIEVLGQVRPESPLEQLRDL